MGLAAPQGLGRIFALSVDVLNLGDERACLVISTLTLDRTASAASMACASRETELQPSERLRSFAKSVRRNMFSPLYFLPARLKREAFPLIKCEASWDLDAAHRGGLDHGTCPRLSRPPPPDCGVAGHSGWVSQSWAG